MTTPEYSNPVQIPTTAALKHDSTLAIVSLVTGIIGWTIVPFIGSIVAVITGHLAKKEIREGGGMVTGDGMALAGLILGYTMIGLTVLGLILFFTVLIAFVPAIVRESSFLPLMLPFCM